MKIELNKKYLPILLNRGMNGSVTRQRPYEFKPVTYTAVLEGLKPRQITRDKQVAYVDAFMEDPFQPRTICINSAPDDGMAKLLAAFLMQHAAINTNSRVALPLWHDLTGGFSNPLLNEKNGRAQGASMLVLNNVGPQSTQPKLEKLRDIIETYTEVPKIVVVTGCDPYTFFKRHLFLPIHGVVYMTTSEVKKVEL